MVGPLASTRVLSRAMGWAAVASRTAKGQAILWSSMRATSCLVRELCVDWQGQGCGHRGERQGVPGAASPDR